MKKEIIKGKPISGASTKETPLLEVKDLKTNFYLDEGVVRAVDGANVSINRRGVLGVVGESGCGKSVLARSIIRIVRPPGRTTEGEILYDLGSSSNDDTGPTNLLDLPIDSPQMRDIRGSEISMIFQEPMVSFSPVHSVGSQIIEGIKLHQKVSEKESRDRAVDMLRRVGIPNPESRIDNYSFNLSGGMRQRAMIAMALSCSPSLLIADEPTTALDVTTQAQILELIGELQEEFGMAVMLISHNLGVVAQMSDEVVVMYLGKVVERADVNTLFNDPKHPYTQELLRSIPRLSRERQTERLTAIEGTVPPPYQRPTGCTFHPRCPKFMAGVCDVLDPQTVEIDSGHEVSCLLYSGSAEEVSKGE